MGGGRKVIPSTTLSLNPEFNKIYLHATIEYIIIDYIISAARIEMKLASRADQRVLRWFGHVERMDEYRMTRRVLMAEVSGGRVRGRPRLGWIDGVKVALGNIGMTVEAARQCAKERKEWRALVHM